MNDILSKMKNLKTQEEIQKKETKIKEKNRIINHPLAQKDIELKIHYLNGLALMMNVDDEISDSEKDFFLSLMEAFNLEKSVIDNFLDFAKEPENEQMRELMEELVKSEIIKFSFMIDVFVMANRDGKYSNEEEELVEIFFKNLKFDEKEIEALPELIATYSNDFDYSAEFKKFKKSLMSKWDKLRHYASIVGDVIDTVAEIVDIEESVNEDGSVDVDDSNDEDFEDEGNSNRSHPLINEEIDYSSEFKKYKKAQLAIASNKSFEDIGIIVPKIPKHGGTLQQVDNMLEELNDKLRIEFKKIEKEFTTSIQNEKLQKLKDDFFSKNNFIKEKHILDHKRWESLSQTWDKSHKKDLELSLEKLALSTNIIEEMNNWQNRTTGVYRLFNENPEKKLERLEAEIQIKINGVRLEKKMIESEKTELITYSIIENSQVVYENLKQLYKKCVRS